LSDDTLQYTQVNKTAQKQFIYANSITK